MAKLFITLYLMVLASFAVFIFFVISTDIIGKSINEVNVIERKISKGTFALLDQSLQGLDRQQTESILIQYKKQFGPEFKLIEKSSLNFDDKQMESLESGNVVSVDESRIYSLKESKQVRRGENDKLTMLYHKIPDSSLVWRVNVDLGVDVNFNDSSLSVGIKGGQFPEGMFYLIGRMLQKEKKENWPDIIKKLEPIFGLPLSLIEINKVINKLDETNQTPSLIRKGEVVIISQNTKNIIFAQKVADSSQLLQVGPIRIPWFMRNFIYLMLLAFALSFATMLLLWIWPLWSNLSKIKKAADDFGSGNYDARISYKKRSPIAKVTQAFNAMAERTQRSIRSQKELTSAVSHELRTPVARMRFAIEMLDASSDKKDKLRYIKDINKDIDELDLLLEELLSYARFDQEKPNINPCLEKLIPWISNSMERLMPLAGNKTLHYKVEGIGVNETSLFEPRLMSRVLDNLVQNALRYARQTIEVTLSKDRDNYLLIVEDDGDGIPTDKQDTVFDAFSRIDASRDRASGGFGLGLAIADRIVKGHQGIIALHNSSLGGAKFEVSWPVKQR